MLKEREQKILDYMKAEIKTKGYPPTVREICTALHIKSTSTAHKDIESLVRQGYLVKDPSKPRALMVVDPQEAFGHIPAGKMPAAPTREAGADSTSLQPVSDVVEIPVVGRVAAGVSLYDFLLYTIPPLSFALKCPKVSSFQNAAKLVRGSCKRSG